MADPCCCLTGDFDSDGNDFYSEEMRTARKEYRCSECHKRILPGDKYAHSTGKTCGVKKIWTNRTCATCDEIRDHFYCGGGWLFGQLWEDIREQIFGEVFRFECMEGLSVKARETVLDDWRKWKGLNA
jgi:predicted RNA-binding Zn-ribbon protein involved in translation (DUF1610 family)